MSTYPKFLSTSWTDINVCAVKLKTYIRLKFFGESELFPPPHFTTRKMYSKHRLIYKYNVLLTRVFY